MQMLPIWNSVEISSNYQWKSFRNKSSRNSNRNLNEVPYEISIIYQWKSIKDPVEMWMKIPMEINKKSSWNLKEIQMKYLWKSIGNPFGISVNGRTDIRGFGTDRLPYSEKLFLIVIFTDPTIISGTVDLRHYVIDTESVALTTSFFLGGPSPPTEMYMKA